MTIHDLLFVDDEKNILNALRRELKEEPYNIWTAESGERAFEILKDVSPALIVSDIRMPEMDGIEFLNKAKKIRPDAVRVILSGFSDVENIITAINENHIYRYMTKPWNIEELKMIIKQCVEYYSMIEERKNLTATINLQNRQLKELNQNLEKIVESRTKELLIKDEILHFLLELHPVEKSVEFILKKICEAVRANEIIFYKLNSSGDCNFQSGINYRDKNLSTGGCKPYYNKVENVINRFKTSIQNKSVCAGNVSPDLKRDFIRLDIKNFLLAPVFNDRTKFGVMLCVFNDSFLINETVVKKLESFILYLSIALNDHSLTDNLSQLNKNIDDILNEI